MTRSTFRFSSGAVDVYPGGSFSQLSRLAEKSSTVIITDENVYRAHSRKFSGWKLIILKPGEEYKVQATADAVINTLVDMDATRGTTLVGVGGGVVTDLTGYAASIFMRGIGCGFVPTTVLGMVDAAIGGKNGVDAGIYKNLAGTTRQPGFILYDHRFLESLPLPEWESGFAEIIKHACIRDAAMLRELEQNSIEFYRKNRKALAALVERNMRIKMKIVQKDEFEKGDRKLLNFGHTLGHALENQYELSHGQAISIGMSFACQVSEALTGFKESERVVNVLEKYNLPAYANFNRKKVLAAMAHDKKRLKKEIHFVLLDKAGKARIKPVTISRLEKFLNEF